MHLIEKQGSKHCCEGDSFLQIVLTPSYFFPPQICVCTFSFLFFFFFSCLFQPEFNNYYFRNRERTIES